MKKALALLLALMATPSFAEFPCSLGDWNNAYYVKVYLDGARCQYSMYYVTCGGILGNTPTWNWLSTSPRCYNL